jgi:hypothetical protein
MNFLAALAAPALPATTLDRLKAIPPEFWLRLGMAVVAIIAVVTFIVVTVVGFNWIYERDEPAWATPVVGFLAGWFPTKGPPPKKPASNLAQKRE